MGDALKLEATLASIGTFLIIAAPGLAMLLNYVAPTKAMCEWYVATDKLDEQPPTCGRFRPPTTREEIVARYRKPDFPTLATLTGVGQVDKSQCLLVKVRGWRLSSACRDALAREADGEG